MIDAIINEALARKRYVITNVITLYSVEPIAKHHIALLVNTVIEHALHIS